MKHYLLRSLILSIFLPFFAIAQESTYPDKGFQVEVGTGLWQPTDFYNASSIPVFSELKYRLQKTDFGIGYSRGTIALGTDIPIISGIRDIDGSVRDQRLIFSGNVLNKTSLYYLLLNYNFKLGRQYFIIGGGFGKYAVERLSNTSVDPITRQGRSFSFIPARSDYFGFVQLGYNVGCFRNYLAFNFVKEERLYSLGNLDHFLNFKTAVNFNIRKKKKQPTEDIADIYIENIKVTSRIRKRFSFDLGLRVCLNFPRWVI